jgi:hypothetical protein
MEQELKLKGNVSVKRIKHSFSSHYPNSLILPILLSLPDEISGEELIGAVAVLLDLMDRERNNNIGGEI